MPSNSMSIVVNDKAKPQRLKADETSTCKLCGLVITGLSDKDCSTRHYYPTIGNNYILAAKGQEKEGAKS